MYLRSFRASTSARLSMNSQITPPGTFWRRPSSTAKTWWPWSWLWTRPRDRISRPRMRMWVPHKDTDVDFKIHFLSYRICFRFWFLSHCWFFLDLIKKKKKKKSYIVLHYSSLLSVKIIKGFMSGSVCSQYIICVNTQIHLQRKYEIRKYA